MSLKRHFELMADCNRWMNGNLYQVAAELPAPVLKENRGAYFGSILGTFNHTIVGHGCLLVEKEGTMPVAINAPHSSSGWDRPRFRGGSLSVERWVSFPWNGGSFAVE